ncbi:hypothetical protein AR687_13355 [Flavobacteriaceae bacterium CRH]|nr:hypothetical protein AR687_13355 [Flavobacteriaceae bacterium CRH]
MILSDNYKKRLEKIFFLLLFFFTINFYSQESDNEIKTDSVNNSIIEYLEISGVVVEDSEPILNVVVIEKGKKNFVMTDKDGKFTIKIPLKNFIKKVVLRFEVLNLEPKEIEIQPNAKYVKVQLNDAKKSSKWKIKFEYEKPDVTYMIIKSLAFIVKNIKISEREKKKNNNESLKKDSK